MGSPNQGKTKKNSNLSLYLVYIINMLYWNIYNNAFYPLIGII